MMKRMMVVLLVVTAVASCAVAKMDVLECRQVMCEAKDLYHNKQYAEARASFAKVGDFANARTWRDACDERLAEVRAGIIEIGESPVIRMYHPSQMKHVGSGKRPLAVAYSGSTGVVPLTPVLYQTLTESTLSENWNYYRDISWLVCDTIVLRVAGVDFTFYDTCSYYIDPWRGYWRMTTDPYWRGPLASEEQIAQALHQREHPIHYTMGHVIDVVSTTRLQRIPEPSGGGGMTTVGHSSEGGIMLPPEHYEISAGDDRYVGSGNST